MSSVAPLRRVKGQAHTAAAFEVGVESVAHVAGTSEADASANLGDDAHVVATAVVGATGIGDWKGNS